MKTNQLQKPKYNMWQNTGFMVKVAWKDNKLVLFLCVALAAATAGVTITELLIAPMILQKVETMAPLGELVSTILGFSVVLLAVSALKAYFTENTLFGRVDVRIKVINMLNQKLAETSFANLLDTRFIEYSKKAS